MISPNRLTNDTFRLLFYHWPGMVRTIVILTGIVFGVSVIWGSAIPFYEASTTVTMLPSTAELGFTVNRDDFAGLSPAIVLSQTHTEFLLSRSLAEKVVRKVLMEKGMPRAGASRNAIDWIFDRVVLPMIGKAYHLYCLLNYGYFEEPKPVDRLVDRLQKRTDIENIPGSYILMITVTWDDPQIAARAANLLAELYVDSTRKANQEEMRLTRQYIEERSAEAEADLRRNEEQVKNFKRDEQFFAPSEETALKIAELSEYTRELTRSRTSLVNVEARIASLKAYESDAGLADLRSQQAGLQSTIAALEKILKDHMRTLESLPETERQYVDLVRAGLQRQRDLNALQNRLLMTKIAEAAQLSAVRVIDRAAAPVYPEHPKVLLNVIAAAVVGFIMALGLALFKEFTHPCIRSPEDLGEIGMTCVGKVPYVPSDPFAASVKPQGRLAALMLIATPRRVRDMIARMIGNRKRVAHRHLEHLLMNLTDSTAGKVIAFASPDRNDGRTHLIQNLLPLLRKHDRKTLVIDANTINPGLHKALQRPGADGLNAVLSGEKKLRDQIQNLDDGVDFVDAGTPGESAVMSARAAERLKREIEDLKADYDVILVESPASREAPDARRTWAIMDSVICVVDTAKTRREDLEILLKELGEAKHDTVAVLNKLKYPGDYDFRI